jgi:hypothetical protein
VAPNQQENTHFSTEKLMRIMNRFLVYKRIISAVKRVKFVSDKMSYSVLVSRCLIVVIRRWCYIIALNVHSKTN